MSKVLEVSKSQKFEDGICVWFTDGYDDEFYYAHGIHRIGEPSDPDASDSMWGWINHMSHKIWWNSGLQRDFMDEVKKHI